MALNLEKFVKGKRFTQEFTLNETLGQVLPKTAAGSAIYAAIADYVSNNSSRVTVSATAPTPTGPGHLWYENDTLGRLFLWTGVQWVDASPNSTGNGTGGVTIAATPPTSPANGALWLDNADTYRLYIWNGVQWVDASPSNVSFDSVALTGNPTATTPPQFDNDTSIATTEFVQRALGNYSKTYNPTTAANLTLAQSDAGCLVYCIAADGLNQNVTLPSGTGLPVGASFTVTRTTVNGKVTVTSSLGQVIDSGAGLFTNVTLFGGETSTFVWLGSSWATEGTFSSRFVGMPASLGTSGFGFQKFPSGLILQWAVVTPPSTDQTSLVFNWPIAFPQYIMGVSFGNDYLGNGLVDITVTNRSLTGAYLRRNGSSGTTPFSAVAPTTILAWGY